MYSLSPVPYLPTGIVTFPFLIIMNDSALPTLLPPFLHSSSLLVSHRDVINHVDNLLVLILRVPSFSLSLCLPPLLYIYSPSMPLNRCLLHMHSSFEGLINHLFTQKSTVMHTSGIIWWLACPVFLLFSVYSCASCTTTPLRLHSQFVFLCVWECVSHPRIHTPG